MYIDKYIDTFRLFLIAAYTSYPVFFQYVVRIKHFLLLFPPMMHQFIFWHIFRWPPFIDLHKIHDFLPIGFPSFVLCHLLYLRFLNDNH